MNNLERIKADTDILRLIGHDTELKFAAKTNGGEYSGPCPFCGGDDRFNVWPKTGRYWCRNCYTAGDVIDYVMKRDSIMLPEAAKILGGVDGFDLQSSSIEPKKLEPKPAYQPPTLYWQQEAKKAIERCEKVLHGPEGQPGRDYLHGRGLTDATIHHFRLAYIPEKIDGPLFTVWPGILIPCEIAGRVWYLKVRSLNANAKSKYLYVKGSKPNALYNAADVGKYSPCVICEGEFNTMIAWQELQDVCAFVSPSGAAKNKLDLTLWGEYLKMPTRLLATFDNDDAGASGAAWIREQYGAFNAPVPQGDLNEFYKSGGDLWGEWLKPALHKSES